jgi:hypothetical protein
MNRKGWIIGITVAVLVLPIIPTSYQVPYLEPIKVIVTIVPYSEVAFDDADLAIEPGEHLVWESSYKSGSSLSVQLEADSPVLVAVLDQTQFSVFEEKGEVDRDMFLKESGSVNASIAILIQGSHFVVAINQNEEGQTILIDSIEISENWEQEETMTQYRKGTRTETGFVSIMDLILGPPVY